MEQAEIEMLVGELETRMDRLRALYDQYFMGIERLEPLVPRKDVERRMAVLRKEQIRNTGLRFKFQTLIAAVQHVPDVLDPHLETDRAGDLQARRHACDGAVRR